MTVFEFQTKRELRMGFLESRTIQYDSEVNTTAVAYIAYGRSADGAQAAERTDSREVGS